MTRKLTPTQLDEIVAAAEEADSKVSWAVEIRGIEVRIPEVVSHQGLLDPDDAAHIARMDPATTLALVAEVRELRAKVGRVRLLHEPSGDPEVDSLSTCDTCSDLDGKSPRWPCDTIKALGEEA